ncbi:MAG: HAD family hydrolase [Candidatus Hodarchaeales archaeon]|jgi:HAD superfamily hydrolase (TIGR01509 family)
MMKTLPVIFFDDGGVLNDNRLRAPQWKKLIAEFFIPQFGGSSAQWKKANEVAFANFMKNWKEKYSRRTDFNYLEAWNAEDVLWLTTMFEVVGIPLPLQQERLPLARKAAEWITPRVHAAIPGIIAVIEALWEKRVPLYTASAGPSWHLKGTLKGMGVDKCFIDYYGPDLVQTPKGGVAFYHRIYNRTNVNPKEAIVIDDTPDLLAMAEKAGATVVQSCATGDYQPQYSNYYHNSDELLEIIIDLMGSL